MFQKARPKQELPRQTSVWPGIRQVAFTLSAINVCKPQTTQKANLWQNDKQK